MTSKVKRILYHGSGSEFERFELTGVRTTSALGRGHYLTPSIDKAKQYGRVVMVFDVDVSGCLDWNNLSCEQREQIESVLLANVPASAIAKYGDEKFEVIPRSKDGLARFRELQSITSSARQDEAKAIMLQANQMPKHLTAINLSQFVVVRWKEAGRLDTASPEQLLALAQEFVPEIAYALGYSGAMFGDEVSVYSADLAKKIGILNANYEETISCAGECIDSVADSPNLSKPVQGRGGCRP